MSKESERQEALFRIIIFFISGIILNIWGYLTFVLVIVNWFIVVIEGKKNKEIASFCEKWNIQAYKFFRYITFVSNRRPFPFSSMEEGI